MDFSHWHNVVGPLSHTERAIHFVVICAWFMWTTYIIIWCTVFDALADFRIVIKLLRSVVWAAATSGTPAIMQESLTLAWFCRFGVFKCYTPVVWTRQRCVTNTRTHSRKSLRIPPSGEKSIVAHGYAGTQARYNSWCSVVSLLKPKIHKDTTQLLCKWAIIHARVDRSI